MKHRKPAPGSLSARLWSGDLVSSHFLGVLVPLFRVWGLKFRVALFRV